MKEEEEQQKGEGVCGGWEVRETSGDLAEDRTKITQHGFLN